MVGRFGLVYYSYRSNININERQYCLVYKEGNEYHMPDG